MQEFEKLCNEYRENKRLIEELEAMNDDLKSRILEIMGDKDVYTAGAAKATHKLVNGTKFDTAAFKVSHPDLLKAFTVPNIYRRFTVS